MDRDTTPARTNKDDKEETPSPRTSTVSIPFPLPSFSFSFSMIPAGSDYVSQEALGIYEVYV